MMALGFNWEGAMGFRAALVALAVLAASSQSAVGDEYIFVGGGQRCGEWTRLRTVGDRGPAADVSKLYQLEQWGLGFLSGVNFAGGEAGRSDFLASKPELSALYAVVDNYCKTNPLDQISDAFIALVKELRSRAATRR
jgi:hypothetical protein